jgi:hypothetical protein
LQCLTQKQVLQHCGVSKRDKADGTEAVPYVVMYVRDDMVSKMLQGSDGDVDPPGWITKRSSQPPFSSPSPSTARIYHSDLLQGHRGRGLLDIHSITDPVDQSRKKVFEVPLRASDTVKDIQEKLAAELDDVEDPLQCQLWETSFDPVDGFNAEHYVSDRRILWGGWDESHHSSISLLLHVISPESAARLKPDQDVPPPSSPVSASPNQRLSSQPPSQTASEDDVEAAEPTNEPENSVPPTSPSGRGSPEDDVEGAEPSGEPEHSVPPTSPSGRGSPEEALGSPHADDEVNNQQNDEVFEVAEEINNQQNDEPVDIADEREYSLAPENPDQPNPAVDERTDTEVPAWPGRAATVDLITAVGNVFESDVRNETTVQEVVLDSVQLIQDGPDEVSIPAPRQIAAEGLSSDEVIPAPELPPPPPEDPSAMPTRVNDENQPRRLRRRPRPQRSTTWEIHSPPVSPKVFNYLYIKQFDRKALSLVGLGVFQVDADHSSVKDVVRKALETPKERHITLYKEGPGKKIKRMRSHHTLKHGKLEIYVVEDTVTTGE